MADIAGIGSSTYSPYGKKSTDKKPESSTSTSFYEKVGIDVGVNDFNTLTMEDYFTLLASQLANQDMSQPMNNAEMMAQMTQMAMVQSVEAMTNSVKTSTAVTTQTYAAGLMGQEITMGVKDDAGVAVGVKVGVVESVSFYGGNPIIKLQDDKTEYPIDQLIGMGDIPDPFAVKEETEDGKDTEDVEGDEGTESGGNVESGEAAEGSE